VHVDIQFDASFELLDIAAGSLRFASDNTATCYLVDDVTISFFSKPCQWKPFQYKMSLNGALDSLRASSA